MSFNQSVIHDVLDNWRKQRISLASSPGADEIRKTLSLLGKPFAEDLVQLYQITGGMLDHEMDDACFSMWPLSKLVEENSKYERPLIAFADFLISSHLYGVQPESPSTSAVYIDHCSPNKSPALIAHSLNEFFNMYMERHENLLLLWQ